MAKDAKKATLKRFFGSFINNGYAIDGAKFSPWWIGLIMFIFGLLLPVLPIFVQAANTNGTSFMSQYEYALGMDKTFGAAINGIDGVLTFDNSEKVISYVANNPDAKFVNGEDSLIGAYISTSGNTNGQYDLRVYFYETADSTVMSNFVESKEALKYKKGTTTIATSEDTNVYTPSSIYFFSKSFSMDIYASSTTTKLAYKNVLADLNCLDYASGDLKAYFIGTSFDINNKDNRINAYKNLETFLNETYETNRQKSMWLGSLIYVGVYASINLFMMLMIFLMSRGKNNPNRTLDFWHCIKIGWWTSLSPGLLGMIVGFIWPANAVMLYVLFTTMRTMWLTMRELRPQY